MPTSPSTKRVLLVDDDPIVIRIYRDGLTKRGFEVTTATDGLGALKALRARIPDIVVLDLMMPKFSGVEVLRYVRSQKETEGLPVIVLSNAYMDPLAGDAADLGAQKGLLKVKCNPAGLVEAINEVLEGQPSPPGPDYLLAAPADAKIADQRASSAPQVTTPQPATQDQTPNSETSGHDARTQARQELALHTPAVARSLQDGCEALLKAHDDRDRKLRLEALYRKIHFITSLAGLAEYPALSQMASAFEALLFGIMDKMPDLQPSLRRTLSGAIAFIQELLQRPNPEGVEPQSCRSVLIVDDDRISNRLVVSSLRNAQLEARATESPELALRWMQEKAYDLVLLDVEMPGLNGLEVCKQLRALPGYEKTPVIFVTLHSDFQTRAKTVLSGGNDLIAKPVLPTELAVKAIMHLLQSRLARPKAG